MNAFVTGGSHCIGQAVIRLLVFQGHHVVRLNERRTLRSHIPRPRIHEVCGSLQKERTWQKALKHCNVVIHLADTPHVDGRHWRRRLEGTRRLINTMVQNDGPKRIIFLSTLGNDRAHSSPAQRVDKEIEHIIRTSGLHYTIFRSTWITGIHRTYPSILDYTRVRYDVSPTAIVQPIALSNVAEGIVKAARWLPVKAEYNLAGPQIHTVREIYRIVHEKKQKKEYITRFSFRNLLFFPSFRKALHILPPWTVNAWCNPVPYFRDFHIRPVRFAETAARQSFTSLPKHSHHSSQ